VDKVSPYTKIIYKGQELPRLDTDLEFNLVRFEDLTPGNVDYGRLGAQVDKLNSMGCHSLLA